MSTSRPMGPEDPSGLRAIELDPSTPIGLVLAFGMTFGAAVWLLAKRVRLAYRAEHAS